MRIGARTADIGGRTLIALLFILAGLAKALGPQPFLDHMAAFGLPGFLLPAVILLEIGAGLALLVGWRLGEAAAALAAFCILTALIFHHDLGDKTERTLFFKDLAIAGGLLAIAATAAGRRTLAPPKA
ncbi:MAG: DoxX family protein [Alphaproteobacteria bacterium]|nr:DoxX family protein [Alphaproteobacteria bacterium]MBV8412357.1 DoxX family protein [Alphaproteobacteria bacterium]